MSEEVEFTCAEGVARIAFNRPAAKNALTKGMTARLLALLEAIKPDMARVVVLEGRGGDFCSGADVKAMGSSQALTAQERTAAFHASIDGTIAPIVRAALALRQPIVAAVRGYAIGLGAQLALLADLIVASETARFVFPQVRLAHTLDHGESWFLPRKVGLPKAMELSLLGEPINAEAANRAGLVNWVVKDAELEPFADKIVSKLLSVAPQSLWRTKALLNASGQNSLEAQLAAERMHVGYGAASEDFLEAVRAFAEKRPPRFTGA
ncbi:MAG: enoyl-CoA hydratase/isomerase family protein [Hyphomonadaceae bacterium]